MGSTFDAIQIAQSCRDKPDIRKTLGLQVEKIIKK